MSNLPETVERAVEGVTRGFAGNTLCLAAVLLSGMFGVLTYFSLTAERHEAHERTMAVIARCFGPERAEPDALPLGGPQGGRALRER